MTRKTILFASVIVVSIITVSLYETLTIVDAVTEDAYQRHDKTLWKEPSPMTIGLDRYIPMKSIDPMSDKKRERLSNSPQPANLSADISTDTLSDIEMSSHVGFGTDLYWDTSNIDGVYSRNLVHIDGIELKNMTYLYAPTIYAPNHNTLEIVTYYGNDGNGTGSEKYVVVFNHLTKEFEWDSSHVIDSDFRADYTLHNGKGDYYYYTSVYKPSSEEDVWLAVVYNVSIPGWETWFNQTGVVNEENGWVGWEAWYFEKEWQMPWDEDKCPTDLPKIEAARIQILHDGAWKYADTTLSDELDMGSACGVTSATYNEKYYDWSVDD